MNKECRRVLGLLWRSHRWIVYRQSLYFRTLRQCTKCKKVELIIDTLDSYGTEERHTLGFGDAVLREKLKVLNAQKF